MARGTPARSRHTTEQFFSLVDEGVLRPGDRVELLEGVVVAMGQQSPLDASAIRQIARTLDRALGDAAVVSVQLPLLAGRSSVCEPDVAVLRGPNSNYEDAHPRSALLVVEVTERSLAQERVTKATIYARAGIPEYWIVNLRDDRVEVYRAPDRAARRYTRSRAAARGERLTLVAVPRADVAVDELLPRRR